jgi:hypothetical protein
MLCLSNMKLKISNIKLEINNEAQNLNNKTQTRKRVLFALGLSLCLTGTFLMLHGSVFGDRTTGIAIVTGILGIGLISTSNFTSGLKSFSRSQSKTANVNNEGR